MNQSRKLIPIERPATEIRPRLILVPSALPARRTRRAAARVLKWIAYSLIFIGSALPSCTTFSPPHHANFHQSGLASWYGSRFQGHKTASGERFNMHELTAAHRTLPLGSRVKVRSVTTGKSVVVRINDRGPVDRSRILDLSHAAANEIGIVKLGTDKIEIESD